MELPPASEEDKGMSLRPEEQVEAEYLTLLEALSTGDSKEWLMGVGQVTGVRKREDWNPQGLPLCHADVTGSLLAETGGWERAGCRARLRQSGCRDPSGTHPSGWPLPEAVPGTSLGIPARAVDWVLVGGDAR